MGLFYPFVDDTSVAMYGVEAAGLGLETDFHAATFAKGRPGVLHGALMDVLQDENGQILEAFSISAGLDYPGIGPEHSYFNAIDRATYVSVTDEEALEGFKLLSRLEGIIPALESSHAIAYLPTLAKELGPDKSIIVCLSGRGDKDVAQVRERLQAEKRRTNMTKTLQVRLQEIKNAQKGILFLTLWLVIIIRGWMGYSKPFNSLNNRVFQQSK
jgi:tryptophan synthase beta chain